MVLNGLKQKLARLFGTEPSEISLVAIEAGLSHKSFLCELKNEKYYIKIYNEIENISQVIPYINQLTQYMCGRGIPASRLVQYSTEFPNIVVHEYVEGETASGEFSQLSSIAELYSKVAVVGLDHSKYLSKAAYLSGIQTLHAQLDNTESLDPETDESIRNGMSKLVATVLSALHTGMPDEELLHIHVHDDFTEKNILMDGDQVKLLCDWDSCRLRYCNEHFASTTMRFSTRRPLDGSVQQDKLVHFLRCMDLVIIERIPNIEVFAGLFPYWASLKHIRGFLFRNSVVNQTRPDLKHQLLEWPLQHCLSLIKNRDEISDWVRRALRSG